MIKSGYLDLYVFDNYFYYTQWLAERMDIYDEYVCHKLVFILNKSMFIWLFVLGLISFGKILYYIFWSIVPCKTCTLWLKVSRKKYTVITKVILLALYSIHRYLSEYLGTIIFYIPWTNGNHSVLIWYLIGGLHILRT